ncbi:hypothetical protein [Nocardioides sp. Root151]|uniref:hypothetical protein n=1 Tax=Nocardioides sp. Root151 TaxID=1736475 RepID=UPI000703306E|nr:hypothetical protein [Nocardioides sp. Root151]KQZ70652.1 hypothetical protein ASD66_13820 [Nocardioides sp. Root151]
MKMRRMTMVALLVSALMLAFTTSAAAGTFKTTAKWRNCDTYKSAISVRVTFSDPADLYGKGKYMVKRWVKWQYYKGGTWRTADPRHTESGWLQINNLKYDYITTAADRTNWLGLYYSHWRAEVTVQLLKNRPGPRDRKVDEVKIFPTKGSFREIGSNCGYEF